MTLIGPSRESVKVTLMCLRLSRSSGRVSAAGLGSVASARGRDVSPTSGTGAVGETTSVGMVTITALDDTQAGPNKTVEVTGTVSEGNIVPPLPRMLKVEDDEDSGVVPPTGPVAVMLVLTLGGIWGERCEHGTAVLSPAAGEPVTVTVTVSASTVAAADAGRLHVECEPGANDCPGQTQSPGTVTVTAVDDDVDGPDQQVTVTGRWRGSRGWRHRTPGP